MKEIIQAFVEQSDQDMALLVQADIKVVKQTAHRMLNMFRQLDIKPMIGLLVQAEKEGIIDAQILDIWDNVRVELTDWLQK